MDRTNDARLTKGTRIIGVMDKYSIEVLANDALKKAVAEFTVRVKAAQGYMDLQVEDIKGNTVLKHQFKELAIDQGFDISGLLYVFAINTGDAVLAVKMKLFISDFRIKDALLLSLLNSIKNEATTHKTALLGYGMTADMLTEYTTNVAGFEANLNLPASAIGVRHDETLGIERELDAADVILETKIEPLMRPYKKTRISFYNEFNSANHNTILGSHKKRVANVVYGIVSFRLRNKTTMEYIGDGLFKIVGEEETHICTIIGSGLIETTKGEHEGKATAIDFNAANVIFNATDVPQVIEILMEPLI